MKKSILTLVTLLAFNFVSVANNNPEAKKVENPKKKITERENINTNKKENAVTVTCSITLSNGVTLTATAGNWFTSATAAADRCASKLAALDWTF